MSPLLISHVLLWVVILLLSLAVLALARQVGVLHQRIAPVGALMAGRGLQVGEAAPVIEVHDIAEQAITVGGTRSDGKSLLVVFVSPTCPICKTLIPMLKASRKSEAAWLEILLASDGERQEQLEYVRKNGLTDFSYAISTPLGLTYLVERLPFAVLVDAEGILRARGLINSREHLESLFEAKRLGVASLQSYLEGVGRRPAT